MTLSYSQLGRNGRIGNCLFQIASTIGLARKNGLAPVFPSWEYDRYFEEPIPHGQMNTNNVAEDGFLYKDIPVKGGDNLVGYLQSEKYWLNAKEDVLRQLEFKKSFADFFPSRSLYARVFEKEVIAIHVRRGDYVENPNYVNLPIEYYHGALKQFFPEQKRMNILVFSDDPSYASTMFQGRDNVTIVKDNSDIDDLCLMSLCSHWVIANSSFSWWAAYLGSNKKGGTVVAPAQYFEGTMKETHPLTDFYPEGWQVYDHEAKEDRLDVALKQLSDQNVTISSAISEIKEALHEKVSDILEKKNNPSAEPVKSKKPAKPKVPKAPKEPKVKKSGK